MRQCLSLYGLITVLSADCVVPQSLTTPNPLSATCCWNPQSPALQKTQQQSVS